MTAAVVEFTAPCPCGNPDALWRCWHQAARGEAGADYLGVDRPAYWVVCGSCRPVPAPAGSPAG